MMLKYLGKRVKITASLVAVDEKFTSKKYLLKHIVIDGCEVKDHAWIDENHTKGMDKYEIGDLVICTTLLKEYIGLDENYNQVKKIGFTDIRSSK